MDINLPLIMILIILFLFGGYLIIRVFSYGVFKSYFQVRHYFMNMKEKKNGETK